MVAILLLSGVTLAWADAKEPAPWAFVGWRLFWENDLFALGGDHDYTNGLQFQTWFAGPDPNARRSSRFDRAVGAWCDRLKRIEPKSTCTADIGFGSGQTFYTPNVITTAAPQLDDHPWGAYKFVSTSLVVSTKSHQHTIEIQAGVVGPSAGGRSVQTKWHAFIDDPDTPMGWANQIRDEPAAEVLYTYRRRWGGANADGIMQLGGGVGTVQDFVSAGLTLRSGWDLRGFGKPVIISLPDAARMLAQGGDGDRPPEYDDASARTPSGAHIFVTAVGRWIPIDTFLRGGTLHHIPTNIDPRPFTWDGSIGVVFPMSRSHRWSLAYEYIRRSSEFVGAEAHRFGSFVLTYTGKQVIPKH